MTTPDLIEKIARAISYRDIRLDWDDCAEEWKDIYRAKATAALSVALDEIGEECAGIAHNHGKVVSNEPIGKACSANIERALRARIADLKRELTIAR